jgi:ActR/RegA family two-component response regulator
MEEPHKILLVDGDHSFRNSTAHALREAGYECHCAHDAANLVGKVASTPYDLLIMDVGVSGNEDLKLVQCVRKMAHGLSIILVTDSPTLETAVAALHMSVAAYLVKPLDFEQVHPHIHRSVARSRLHRVVSGVRTRSILWDSAVSKLQDILEEPFEGSIAELVGPILKTTFAGVIASVADLRRMLDCLVAPDHTKPPSEVMELLKKLELTRNALRETISVLEESKHAFKSKRLGELRRQLQALLGILEQQDASKSSEH